MEEKLLIKFLKSIAKMSISENEEFFIKSCISRLDYTSNEVIEKHKLQYLFLRHINRLNLLSCLDANIKRNYSNQLFYLQFKYKEYIEVLNKLCVEFNENKIPYAVLKGMSITHYIYIDNNIVYRPFSDVDILIDNSQIDKVDNILKKANFIQGSINDGRLVKADRKDLIYWKLNSHQLHKYVAFSKYSYISANFNISVDINTSVFEGGRFKDPILTSVFLSNCIYKKISSIEKVSCLNHTYNLIQLCYHFYKDTKYETKKNSHDDYCLMKFCDIREYLLRYRDEINWKSFIDIINNAQIGNQIYYSLWIVDLFYGDLNIDSILDQIKITEKYFPEDINWEKILL